MTALEASQRAVMFLMAELSGGAAPKKKRRNRGAARRAKSAAGVTHPYTDDTVPERTVTPAE